MSGVQATYEDRRTGRSVPVRLSFAAPWLVIGRDGGGELDRWPWREVATIPGPFADDRLRLGLAADAHAVLAIDGPDALWAQAQAAGMGNVDRAAHRTRRDLPLIIWIGGALASFVILLQFVVPAFSGIIAPMIPASWQARIGDQVLVIATALLTRKDGNPHCAAPDGRAALDKLAARLPASAGRARLLVIDSELPNAFALPGGHVAITNSLMDKAEGPDAVLGVIGHELGHLHHGHSMERVIRYSLSSAIVSMAVGDVGGGFLAVGVSQMVESEFSQDQERQADAFALDALARAGVSPRGLAQLFRTIRDEHPEADGAVAEWAGSHPTLSERIATLEAADSGRAGAKVLENPEWAALRAICRRDPTPPA